MNVKDLKNEVVVDGGKKKIDLCGILRKIEIENKNLLQDLEYEKSMM